MSITEKITFFIAIWIIIMLFVTSDIDLEIFFILIFLGFIFIIELAERFTTAKVKHRLNILLYVLIMIFVVIIGKKIITFLGI